MLQVIRLAGSHQGPKGANQDDDGVHARGQFVRALRQALQVEGIQGVSVAAAPRMTRRHTTQLEALGANPYLFEEVLDLRATPALGPFHLEVGDRGAPIPEAANASDDVV